MKTKTKKYPLLISLIISCAVIVASLFILGFMGIKTGTSIAGGSQFEVVLNNDASSKTWIQEINQVLKNNDVELESSFVEEKFVSGSETKPITTRCLVFKVTNSNISDELETKIATEIAEKLEIEISAISEIENITSSVTSKNVLFLGLAIGVVAIFYFVVGLIRYDVFAGIALLISFIHNLILYLALVIVTRLELNLVSLSIAVVLTLIMSLVLIAIFEKYKEQTEMHYQDIPNISERMIYSEKRVVKPYLFIAIALIIVALMLLFIPVNAVRVSAVNIIIALLCTIFTSLVVGPGVYAALLEVRDIRIKAILSRNDTVNKAIKNKIKKNTQKTSNV